MFHEKPVAPNPKTSETFWIMFEAQLEEGSITYREWVPNAKQVFLIGDFNKWENTTPLTSEARIHDSNFERSQECLVDWGCRWMRMGMGMYGSRPRILIPYQL